MNDDKRRIPTPQPDAVPEVVREEQELLAAVAAVVGAEPEPGKRSEQALVSDLQQVRQQLVEGTAGSDEVALTDQWNRQSALLRQVRRSAKAARVDQDSPYFAHLRLLENGEPRDLCLGRATLIRKGVRIVDWRNAPVSRLFYRYEQGEDFEENFAGRLRTGSIVARRTVSIREAVLERVEGPEESFVVDPGAVGGWRRSRRGKAVLAGGEGAALRAHSPGAGSAAMESQGLGGDPSGGGRGRDKRLPEITGLIDPVQFQLITRMDRGFLAIRGTAGSGKTTVALHRIAYLAFEDERIDSPETLFVVFSPALERYVNHVLPALGVHHVAIHTFRDWVAGVRKRHFPRLPDELREDAPSAVQRMKLHPAMATALEEHIRSTEGPGTREQALDDWMSVLTHSVLLRSAFERVAPGEFRATEIERAVEDARDRNERLSAWLAGDGESEATLDPEDDALLLRCWQLRVGALRGQKKRTLRYRHIVIDEIQDFSPIEVQLLTGCLDRNRSITLAGDAQQRIVSGSGFTTWTELLDRLGLEGTSLETLQISYRCSREILEFGLSILGDLREEDSAPQSVRTGPPVELFRFTEAGACVAFLAEALRRLVENEPMASVGLLCPDVKTTSLYHDGLVESDVPGVRRVEAQDFTFLPGIEVTEITQVKGLEFDYVILVGVDAEHFPDDAESRRLLHVGATRAIHQLWLVCVDPPSPLLEGLAESGS